ncbi:hypothetical protein Tco_0615811 [Tanacetum coccineum]
MADNRTMAQLLQAPTKGYEDAIVIPEINANFELKHDVLLFTIEVSELKNYDEDYLIDNKSPSTLATRPKSVEQSCVTCRGAHSYRNCPATDGNVYRDNIQEYVSQAAAANFNQGNTNSRPPMVANQLRPPSFPPIQNNQNRFNQNQGNNFNQNRGTNFNQNRENNFYQGQVYQPPTSQPPVYQDQPYQAPAQQMQGVSKTDFENYVKANDAVLRNMQNQGQDVQPSVVPVENQNPVSEPDVAPVSAPMPNPKPSIPYPSRRNDEKAPYEDQTDMSADMSIRGTRWQDMCACVSTSSGVYGSVPIIGNREAVSGEQKDYNTPRSSNMSGGVLERTKLPLPLGGYK